jgi:N-methylhydantoinase A
LIAVDVGGTFTDVSIADARTGRTRSLKTSTDPSDPATSFERAVRLALETAEASPGDVALTLHATTIATNAILEATGARVALITTAGFRHVLEIGRHDGPRRTSLLHWVRPARPVPADRVIEVAERISHLGQVERPLDRRSVEAALTAIGDQPVDAVAVCLINAYAEPAHERLIRDRLAVARPDLAVSISSDVLPVYREYERTMATLLDAYVKPSIAGYVGRLTRSLERAGVGLELQMMRSDGGLAPISDIEASPIRTVLSGPAAAVVAAAEVARRAGFEDAISLDVGGTSTDVALIRSGEPMETEEGSIGPWPLALPTIDVHSIGAGGGSIAWLRADGTPAVGPTSAGSRPGPACYGQGGDRATVTDADLVLGRIPDRIARATVALDHEAAAAAIRTSIAGPLASDPLDAAWGIIEIAEDDIAAAIRLVTTERGYDPRAHTLVAGGGAGPLRATGVADRLGITNVVVPAAAGVLATLGLLGTDLRHQATRTDIVELETGAGPRLRSNVRALKTEVDAWFEHATIPKPHRHVRWTASLRYAEQASELLVEWPEPGRVGPPAIEALARAFHVSHERRYGYRMSAATVECVTLRADAIVVRPRARPHPVPSRERREATPAPKRPVYAGRRLGFVPARIVHPEQIPTRHSLAGPLVVEPADTTVWVPPHWRIRRLRSDDLLLEVTEVR